MSTYPADTRDFLKSTRGVIGAVDMLRTALSGGDAGEIDFATESLAGTVDNYAGRTTAYSNFGFDELARPALDQARREQVHEDLLAGALVDLEVANTLITAGRVAGESGETMPVETLDEARQQLETVTNAVAKPIEAKTQAAPGAARFGFDETPRPPAVTPSASDAEARTNYAKQSNALLDDLAVETKKVIQEAASILKKLEPDKLGNALDLVGKTLQGLPQIGKLISKGLELVSNAIGKITSLIGDKNIGLVKDKAREVYEKIKGSGDQIDQFLAYSYGKTKTSQYIQNKLDHSTAAAARIDAGAQKLSGLQTRFAERMIFTQRIIKVEKDIYAGLLTACEAVALVPSLNITIPATVVPLATLVVASSCLVVVGYAVLTGMDCADTAKVFAFMPGIITITDATLI